MKRNLLFLLAIVAFALSASADDPTYTGCLKSSSGRLYKVQAGTVPGGSCNPGDTIISWNRRGPAGPQGPQGQPGQNAAENIVVRSNSGAGLRTATCNAGERVVGGGAAATTGNLTINGPDPIAGTPTGWTALASTGNVNALVLCASP